MVMLQWAALPADGSRQHATVTALTLGRLRLAMNQTLLTELRDLFFRPELQARLPSLTPERAALILQKSIEFADWFDRVPARFSLPDHPKDNHLFNLAIAARATYLV
jgi:predicted nucleic acid-binding protein